MNIAEALSKLEDRRPGLLVKEVLRGWLRGEGERSAAKGISQLPASLAEREIADIAVRLES